MRVLLAIGDPLLGWAVHVTVNEELQWIGARVESMPPERTQLFEEIWKTPDRRYGLAVVCSTWDELRVALSKARSEKIYSKAPILWIPKWKASVWSLGQSSDPEELFEEYEKYNQVYGSVKVINPLKQSFGQALRKQMVDAIVEAACGSASRQPRREGLLDWDPTWTGDYAVVRLLSGKMTVDL